MTVLSWPWLSRGFGRFSAPRLRVDFNGLGAEESGVVSGLRLDGIVPEVGEPVWLYDGEGNTCLGALVRVRHAATGVRVYEVRADPTTWRDGPSVGEATP